MFERFTEPARQVVVLAQEEAIRLRHDFIGTEHLLLGLLREAEGIAARVLEAFDVTVEEVRAQVVRIVGEGDKVAAGQIPFTPRAKRALELSLREALRMGHDYIGTEHVLLGLDAVGDSVAARILRDFDLDPETVRRAVGQQLAGRPSPVPGATARSAGSEKEVEIEGESSILLDIPGARTSAPLVIAIVLAAVGFPLGLLVGFLIWG